MQIQAIPVRPHKAGESEELGKLKKKDIISIIPKKALIVCIGMVLCSFILVMPVAAANEGKISFCSYRDGDSEIYVMNVNGSNQTRLTYDPATDQEPSWAPDGSKIVFSSDRGTTVGYWAIYVMNANGTNPIRLTTHANKDSAPAWSPDGSKIAFSSSREGNPEIYVMNANGSNQTRLTTNGATDTAPAWSPDGSKIAFHTYRDGNYEIYVMNANGSNQTRLTNSTGVSDKNPAWSPDGSKVAFDSNAGGMDDTEIYVINPNGTGQIPLTNNTVEDMFPAWSPDGSKIAFSSKRDAYEIFIMMADGTGETRLTTNTAPDVHPAWSSDAAPITVISPNGGEQWQQGTIHPINWTYAGSPGLMVMIELLKGTTVDKVLSYGTSTGTGGFGSLNWTIPHNQTIGTDYRIRITSTSNPVYTDTSDAPFSMNAGSPITVLSPNGGEQWQQGSTKTLRWKYSGDPGWSVKIEVIKGPIVQVIAPGVPLGSDGSGSFNFTFPFSAPLGSDYRIRVTSTTNAMYNDTSDAPFAIIPPLTVIFPNGGEDWQQGTTRTIRWNYIGTPGPTVKIEALKGDDVLAVISPGTPVGTEGSGSLPLMLPINAPVGTNYRIRVSSTTNSVYTDTSDASFRIVANTSSSVTVVSPNGGENFVQGSNQTIRWTYTGNPGSLVKIEALRNGTVLAVIAPGTSIGSGGSGFYNLTFPYNTPLGSGYQIRVSSTSNPGWTDTSNAPFTIIPAITVVTPNGGEKYPLGSNLSMSWTYAGNPGSMVNIDVLKGPTVLKTLTGIPIGSGGSGSLNVTIPASTPPGSDYSIRVTSASYPACVDASNGMFTIGAPS